MSHSVHYESWVKIGVYLVAVAGVFGLYHFAWSGSFHFDDAANLSGLSQFQETGDWLAWISAGHAGPGGRSVALASFLLDGLNWPDPAAFLYTNSLIHVLNGLLLALVLLRITAAQAWPERDQTTVALLASLLWVLLPLLASSSLLVVQRMTTLAASFMLLGLYLYLLGRAQLWRRPLWGVLWMSLGVGGGTLLGFLSKENAILLPLLVLITEATVLRRQRPPATKVWRLSRVVLLVLPSLLVMAYLLNRIPGGISGRDFSLSERLATQTVILWDYLRLMFIPHGAAFSPFHDAYPIYTWQDYRVLIASGAWIGVIALALWRYRQWTWFAFALFWYLGAHLIESSVIGLELYFQHRNYIPAIGPVVALVAISWRWAIHYQAQRLAVLIASAYLALMATVLGQTTSLWGQPALAAEMWYLDNPHSQRAANFLARQLLAEQQATAAFRVLETTQQHRPESAELALQLLQLSCQMHDDLEQQHVRLDNAIKLMSTGVISLSSIDTLQRLRIFADQQECPEIINLQTLEILAKQALQNSRLRGGRQSRAHFNLYLAELHIEQRDFNATMQALERALDAALDLNSLAFTMAVLNSAGLYEQALEFALAQNAQPPRHPLKRIQWLRDYDAMLEAQRNLIADRNSE